MKLKLTCILALLSSMCCAIAQDLSEPQPAGHPSRQLAQSDIIFLKSGRTVRGVILAMVPDSIVRIRMEDGRDSVLDMKDVVRTLKEPTADLSFPELMPYESASGMDIPDEIPRRRIRVSLQVGAALPLGGFGSTTSTEGGSAGTGFSLSMSAWYPLDDLNSWTSSIFLASNGFDASAYPAIARTNVGSWFSLDALTGVRFTPYRKRDVELYLQSQIGLLLGSTPEFQISTPNKSFRQMSGSGTSFALSLGAGLIVRRVVFSLSYTYGEPSYEVDFSRSEGSYTSGGTLRFAQPTGLVHIMAGIIL
jgi:hypothetical protein